MRVLAGLRTDHELCVACPSAGPLASVVQGAGIAWRPLPAVGASLRLHPVQTPLGVGQLGAAGVALARVATSWRPDVIHANSARAGILASVARTFGAPAFVVRAHEHLPFTPVGRSVRTLLVRRAGALVAVSDFTARKLNEGLERPVATRVYNSIDHGRFDAAWVRPAALRDELGLSSGSYLIGQVAQITPWKGQDTAIRALPALRRLGLDVHLALVGQIAFGGPGVRYDNRAYLRDLERLTDDLGLRGAVHFMGQRDDIPQILRALDLHLLPSREEPFGLVTVESMALGTPPLVSSDGAGPELVDDRISGRILPPDRPGEWAQAVAELLSEPRLRSRMAARGPESAERFRDERQAAELLEIYEHVAKPGSATGARAVAHGHERMESGWRS